MIRARLFVLAIVPGLLLSAAAFGQTAFTTREANVRAGPSKDYPVVLRLGPGTPVSVAGCVDDWTWCDVIFGPDRGWVYAGSLEYPYRDRRVVILGSGAYIGLPIVPFAVGPYWDTYYRGRPWYRRRSYWIHHALPLHRGPVVARPPFARPSAPRHVARAPVPRPAAPPPHVAPAPRPAHLEPARPRPQPPRPNKPRSPHDPH